MSRSAILSFYGGAGVDHAGRRFDEILAWDPRRLEMIHDYIQWLFPLPEPSRFNPDAPLLSPADMAAFRSSPELQAQALRALDVMLGFYNLARTGAGLERTPAFNHQAQSWLAATNHNHLRITRILLFLTHVGLISQAQQFLRCLEDIAAKEGRGTISERTLSFWREAVKA